MTPLVEKLIHLFWEYPELDDLGLQALPKGVQCVGHSPETGWRTYGLNLEISHPTEALQEFVFSEHRRLDPFCPSAGGALHQEGLHLRWHSIMPPMCSGKGLLMFRRLRFQSLELKDFSIPTPLQGAWSEFLPASSRPTWICGPTGSGKSSLLVAYLKAHHIQDRVLILEDYEELPLLSPFWSQLFSTAPGYLRSQPGKTLDKVFQDSLRLRPDVFVIGELRDESQLQIMLKASASGHLAAYATFHCANEKDLQQRLATENFLSEVSPRLVFMERGHPPKVSGFRL